VVLLVNFGAVPACCVLVAKIFGFPTELATGMVLLASAPFAPIVPVLARLAGADLALAVGLTSLIPFISALLTPAVCVFALRFLAETHSIRLSLAQVFVTLMLTILLPLGVGMTVREFAPLWAGRIQRPVEVASEAAGLLSVAFVTVTQFQTILGTGWPALLGMTLMSEISLLMGYASIQGECGSRFVVALGTSNRNISLALLLAIQNYPGTAVPPAVVANGFVLILLGLFHAAAWRCFRKDRLRS
jgi:BASS family bile acid:Na+ symporter